MSRTIVTLSAITLMSLTQYAHAADREAWDRYFQQAEQSRGSAITNASQDVVSYRRVLRNNPTPERAAILQEKIQHLKGLRSGSIMPQVSVSESSSVGEIVSLGGDSTSISRVVSPTGCIVDRMSRSQEVKLTPSGNTHTLNGTWHEFFWIKGINTRGMSRDVVHSRGRHTTKIDHASLFEVVGTQTFEFPDGTKKELVVLSKIDKAEVDAQFLAKQSE